MQTTHGIAVAWGTVGHDNQVNQTAKSVAGVLHRSTTAPQAFRASCIYLTWLKGLAVTSFDNIKLGTLTPRKLWLLNIII